MRQPLLASALALTAIATLAGQAPDAATVLGAARDALGGDRKLAAVKTFTVTGRTRQLRGNNLVPIEFEIDCELPDRFVRKDEFPAQDTDTTVAGFVGNQLIVYPAPAARAGGPPPETAAQQRLAGVKQDFARLVLGAFA